MMVHEAALAAGKLTRDGTGGQLTFPEVIRLTFPPRDYGQDSCGLQVKAP
jgi:hypothetical protein